MKLDRQVFKALALITQLGVTMITPILLCVFIGYIIDKKFETNWFVLFLVLGLLAAIRNAYYLTRDFYTDKKGQEDEEK